MVIFRKETKKKNANRSTPCILVQNLGVSGKRTYSSCCFLSSHQMLGRGAWAGGVWREREVRVFEPGRPFLPSQAGRS